MKNTGSGTGRLYWVLLIESCEFEIMVDDHYGINKRSLTGEICGDGTILAPETCDDGNILDN